jgi:methylamine dehydrogenase accessory protein MauD
MRGMELLIVSVVLLWILVLALAILVVLLYRQFGLIYIGSRGRVELTGLQVGTQAPATMQLEVEGETALWSLQLDSPMRATFLLMSALNCELCAHLIPLLNSSVERWGEVVRFLVVDRGEDAAGVLRELPERREWAYAVSPDGSVHDTFDVDATPFAFVLDHEAKVLAKGLVNVPEHVDGLIARGLEGGEGSRDEDERVPSGRHTR